MFFIGWLSLHISQWMLSSCNTSSSLRLNLGMNWCVIKQGGFAGILAINSSWNENRRWSCWVTTQLRVTIWETIIWFLDLRINWAGAHESGLAVCDWGFDMAKTVQNSLNHSTKGRNLHFLLLSCYSKPHSQAALPLNLAVPMHLIWIHPVASGV